MPKILPFTILLLGMCLLPVFGQSQDKAKAESKKLETDYLSKLTYRSVGPSRGGRATTVTGIPDQPFTFFMGATGGGVWKTEDAGTSWKNISDGQIEAGSIGAIAVAPSDQSTIYVGTGESCPRGNVSPGIGMYKSSDGGKNWKHVGLPAAGQIGKIIVHPENHNWVYVAALGNIFGPNKERGVYRTKDGGVEWEQVLYLNDSVGAIDLTINPHNPREIYAAMWRAERKPWTLVDGDKNGGIWKTMDAGDNWNKLEGGLPKGKVGKIGLALSPAKPDRVWAIIAAEEEEEAGLYRTDNAGQSWKRVSRDHKLRQRAWYYNHVTADPKDENTVYICNVNFFKSIDGGKNFDFQIRVPHGDNHGLWINPNNTKIMVQSNDGGACVSLNGGETWSTQRNQPTAQFYRVTIDNQFPYRLYAGQQDNSTITVPSHSIPGITPYQHWFSVGGSECGDVGINPQNPDLIWAGSYSGEITIMNRKTGQVRQVTAYPHYTEGTEQRDLKYRWQWNFPILVSAHQSGHVYHTSNFVHRTTDDGQTWERISPDLTRQLDQYHDIPGGPIQHDGTGVEIYSTIFAFEESPHHSGEFWAGSDDGLLHISRDNGESWQDITPPDMPEEGTINKIELSSHSPGRAFVAVYNYRYQDFTPYLYRTDDYGKTWKSLVNSKNGIPSDHFIRAIAEDPDRKGLLYVGTEFGMYISFDDGQRWQSFQQNLPHVPITDIEVHEKDLVLSTQGRSFWIMDDLSPLHQVNTEQLANENVLFAPRPAIRTNVSGYRANIHLFLQEKPSKEEPVEINITDDAGKLVRKLSTNAKAKLNRIKLKKGLNTITWDLRHQGPELVKDLVTMVIRNPSPGPWAVPGSYNLEVSHRDWEANQKLEIKSDPRWEDVSNEDYEAQLILAQEVQDMISDAHRRIKNIRSVKDQMKRTSALAVKAGKTEALEALSKSITEQLDGIEDQLIQNKAEVSQDNINYPRVFSNHIGRLYSVLVNAHHRPTGGVVERFEDLKVEYQKIVTQYDSVFANSIRKFNTMLEGERVDRIIVPERVKP